MWLNLEKFKIKMRNWYKLIYLQNLRAENEHTFENGENDKSKQKMFHSLSQFYYVVCCACEFTLNN